MPQRALIIVDVQEDFLPPNGSLAVKDGRDVIPIINELSKSGKFDLVVTTQDWHPPAHISFATTHTREPFTAIQLASGEQQMLWPDHCVQQTQGAEIAPELDLTNVKYKVKKGTLIDKDAYSGFQNTDQKSLASILREESIQDVYTVGVATDYCVRATAIDSHDHGFNTFVIKEGVKGVYPDKEGDTLAELENKGIKVISVSDL